MNWTKELPSEPGWYWLNYNGNTSPVEVDFSSGDYLGEIRIWFIGSEVESLIREFKNCYWQGPIPMPTPPEGE